MWKLPIGWHIAALMGGFAGLVHAIKCVTTREGPFQFIRIERPRNMLIYWIELAMFLFAALLLIGLGIIGLDLFIQEISSRGMGTGD